MTASSLEERTYLRDIAHNRDFVENQAGTNLTSIAGRENVRQWMFRTLMTRPGTVVHRPDYGVGMQDYQGAPNTIENQRRLAQRIKDQFERDPRISQVLGVTVTLDDYTPEKIIISCRVELVGFTEETLTFIPFGEAT